MTRKSRKPSNAYTIYDEQHDTHYNFLYVRLMVKNGTTNGFFRKQKHSLKTFLMFSMERKGYTLVFIIIMTVLCTLTTFSDAWLGMRNRQSMLQENPFEKWRNFITVKTLVRL